MSLGGDLFQLVVGRVRRGFVVADGDFVAMSLGGDGTFKIREKQNSTRNSRIPEGKAGSQPLPHSLLSLTSVHSPFRPI